MVHYVSTLDRYGNALCRGTLIPCGCYADYSYDSRNPWRYLQARDDDTRIPHISRDR